MFRKRLSWLLTSVTLNFDLWPWLFAWPSLLSLVTTPKNFMMIWWWELSQKGVTDGQIDRQTDWIIHRAAWSQLKILRRLSEIIMHLKPQIFSSFLYHEFIYRHWVCIVPKWYWKWTMWYIDAYLAAGIYMCISLISKDTYGFAEVVDLIFIILNRYMMPFVVLLCMNSY